MVAQGWGTVDITNHDPWCASWSFNPEYFGETNYGESDVPGTPGAVANFFSLLIQAVDTGQFRPTPCYLSKLEQARYKALADSCTNAWIWTNP
jgi:hypothetical protein